MFNTETVLVLGAGASAPYGYPRGTNVLDRIVKGIRSTQFSTQLYNKGYEPSFEELDFSKTPYQALWTYLCCAQHPAVSGALSSGAQAWKSFAYMLETSHISSIDELARTNPDQRNLLKVMLALELGKSSIDDELFSRNTWIPNKTLFERRQESWYAKLLEAIHSQCVSKGDLADINLSIVTFNYDMSLEYYLQQKFAAPQLFNGADYREFVPIHHIHGKLAFEDLKTERRISLRHQFGEAVIRAAANFSMLGENKAQHSMELGLAKTSLRKAKRIFVLGMDLHPANVEAIGLDEGNVADKTFVLNWDGSERVQQRALELGVQQQHIFKGTRERPLEIWTAIEDGLFHRRL